MSPQANIFLGVIIVLLIVLVPLYVTCNLNSVLPASLQKTGCSATSGFVGAYARVPEMQNCLSFSGPFRRAPYFNRCTWC